jgi:hypothetical protein
MNRKWKQRHRPDRSKITIICLNCGKTGHTYKHCDSPITSIGVIPIQVDQNLHEYKVLLVQRKYSLSMMSFMCGRYDASNKDIIIHIFTHITSDERDLITSMSFDELWVHVWEGNTNNDQTFKIAKSKYLSLQAKNKDFFQELFTSYSTTYLNEPEWGFPKGRRADPLESDLSCGLREFVEETGFRTQEYVLIDDLNTYTEIFLGSDKVQYKHIYYVALILKETLPIEHSKEIGQKQWFTFTNAYGIFNEVSECKAHIIEHLSNSLQTSTLSKMLKA